MRIISLLFVTALTVHATVASPLPPTPVLFYAESLRPVGTISVSGASTLDDLVAILADEAYCQGAIAWWVSAASSGNRLHGSAIIYQ